MSQSDQEVLNSAAVLSGSASARRGGTELRVIIASLTGGGAERVCLELCNGWAALGLRVELIMARASGPFLKDLHPAVQAVDLKVSRALKSLVPLLRHLRRQRDVPTLIIGFEYAFGLIAARRIGLVDSPLIYRESSSPLANVPRAFLPGYKLFIRY